MATFTVTEEPDASFSPAAGLVPTTVPSGTSSHSKDYVEAGKTEAAHSCVVYGAKAMAGASLDMLTDCKIMESIKREFAEKRELYR